MFFCAAARSIWKSMRARVERPADGELLTTSEGVEFGASQSGKYSLAASISPDASSQFSANVACKFATASPSMRNIVSRQRG
jgi:hypothetical protein